MGPPSADRGDHRGRFGKNSIASWPNPYSRPPRLVSQIARLFFVVLGSQFDSVAPQLRGVEWAVMVLRPSHEKPNKKKRVFFFLHASCDPRVASSSLIRAAGFDATSMLKRGESSPRPLLRRRRRRRLPTQRPSQVPRKVGQSHCARIDSGLVHVRVRHRVCVYIKIHLYIFMHIFLEVISGSLLHK
ncbi:hypothetical protein LY76DRAFT_105472 [Colletotrichum caudatum]|nr:hypothetical protein LY76DRAFT_105472 [Colletotrichum caudatum]